jgi:hypothetical protein
LSIVVTADTDEDGLSDAWEQHYFHNLDEGPLDDPDGDGIVNFRELLYGTDPTSADNGLPAMSWFGLFATGILLGVAGYMKARMEPTSGPRLRTSRLQQLETMIPKKYTYRFVLHDSM